MFIEIKSKQSPPIITFIALFFDLKNCFIVLSSIKRIPQYAKEDPRVRQILSNYSTI
ncbi:hypothetical protein [Lactococcus allomyrinae]|uniref:hypothetical protein n=1 Tax=Lactococcus allomyrinae TaxID=2419773 RepID=UPI003B84A92D